MKFLQRFLKWSEKLLSTNRLDFLCYWPYTAFIDEAVLYRQQDARSPDQRAIYLPTRPSAG